MTMVALECDGITRKRASCCTRDLVCYFYTQWQSIVLLLFLFFFFFFTLTRALSISRVQHNYLT